MSTSSRPEDVLFRRGAERSNCARQRTSASSPVAALRSKLRALSPSVSSSLLAASRLAKSSSPSCWTRASTFFVSSSFSAESLHRPPSARMLSRRRRVEGRNIAYSLDPAMDGNRSQWGSSHQASHSESARVKKRLGSYGFVSLIRSVVLAPVVAVVGRVVAVNPLLGHLAVGDDQVVVAADSTSGKAANSAAKASADSSSRERNRSARSIAAAITIAKAAKRRPPSLVRRAVRAKREPPLFVRNDGVSPFLDDVQIVRALPRLNRAVIIPIAAPGKVGPMVVVERPDGSVLRTRWPLTLSWV